MRKSGVVALVLMLWFVGGLGQLDESDCEDSNGDAIVCWRSPGV